MTKLLPVFLLLLSFTLSAESSKIIDFEGQSFENLLLENKKVETRYREEEVDDTCTRQIPYTVNECGYETLYRTECRTIPAHQSCRTVQDRTCRNVTRYREQCTSRGGGRTCRTVSGRRQCRTLPSGEQSCRNLPTHQVCTNKPPVRTCLSAPYTDRVCTTTPRRSCTWVPSRQSCTQVPYQQYICRDVIRYRSEDYACRRTVQVPYDVIIKLFSSNIDAHFSSATSYTPKARLDFKLNNMGENSLEVADLSEKPTLILSKKKIVSEDLGDSLNIKATYKLKFLEMNKILAPVQKTIGSFYLNETYLSFIIGKVINPTAIKVSVIIKRKNKTILSKELSSTQYKLVDVESGSKVRLSLKRFGIDLRRRKHEVTVKIEMIFNDNILNVNKPKLINRKTVTIKALKD